MSFADLGEKPQAPLPEFAVEARQRKNLFYDDALRLRGTRSTRLVEKIDKGLGVVSSEAPSDVHVGTTA